MKDRITALLATICLVSTAPAFAESVTLREAIGRALHNNHVVKAADLQRRAAEEEVASSRSRYLPRIYLESGAQLSNTPSKVFMMKLDEARIDPDKDFNRRSLNHPDPRGDFRSAVMLEQPLLDFGISTGVKMAGKDAESAALSLEARREQIAFRTYLAYLEVRRAAAYRDIADQAVADAREHCRLAGLRERDGVGLKSEQLRAATELSEAQQRAITAKNDLLLAQMKLNLVVGGAQGEPLGIAETPSLPEPAATGGDLAAVAQQTLPELRMAEKGVEKGDLAVRQARQSYLPTVYASAGYQVNDRDVPFGWDNDSWSLGVNLRWELFDGARRSHDVRKAELAKQSASALLEDERREVALRMVETKLRREEAGLKIETSRAAVKAGEEALRLGSLRFKNGLSPLVELLDLEAALNRARAGLVEAENAFLASTGELYYNAGVFLKEVMR